MESKLEVIGTWKIIKFAYSKVSNTAGGIRRREYWLVECLNCQYSRNMLKHNLIGKCQNCWGREKGYSGLMVLLDSYIRNAKKNKRDFKLTLEEFQVLTSSPCHYCDSLPIVVKKAGKSNAKTIWGNYKYNGIDRVDNKVGYVKSNCVSCCVICNRAKGTIDYTDFLQYINRIKNNIELKLKMKMKMKMKDGENMHIGKNFINGEWYESKIHFNKLNPVNEEVIGKYPVSTVEEIQYAVSSADIAFKLWRTKSRLQRAEYFDNLAQLIKRDHQKIAEMISLETGKSLNESNAEVTEALHMVQFTFGKARMPVGDVVASEIPGKRIRIIRKPRGVTAVITPWNFPYALPFWTSAPALLEGNTVVFKPSENSPGTGELITQLYSEAGFPKGTFNLIQGRELKNDATSEWRFTGEQLVNDGLVKTVLFTGSARVGAEIQRTCAEAVDKICSCETGSKSAVIIHHDADLDLAVDASIASFSKLSGQRCVSASRIIVHERIIDQFIEKFIEKVKKLRGGNPFKDNFEYGPLIDAASVKRVMLYNDMVRNDKQATILFDAAKRDKDENGFFLGPFIFKTQWRNVPYLKTEIFGLHVAVIPYYERQDEEATIEEACRIYNDTDFALAVGIITKSQKSQAIFESLCEAGMMYFNGGCIAAESHLPFGGSKRSGNNRPSAAGTFDTVVNTTVVTENLNDYLAFPQGMK